MDAGAVTPTKATPSASLTSATRDEHTWSVTADALKRGIVRWRAASLTLLLAGAALEAVAVAGEGAVRSVSALAGAAVLAVVPVIRAAKLTRERHRDWVRARSASEAMKAEVFTYLTRTGLYEGVDPEAELLRRCGDIQETVKDLGHYRAVWGGSVAVPLQPERLGIDDYITVRVNAQIETFYEPKARSMARRLRWARGAEFALALLAAVLGVIAAQLPDAGVAGWAPVLTTAIAAIAAHVEAGRYEYQAISYLGTAQRLRRLRDGWLAATAKAPPTKAQMTEFVRQSEDAISSENQSWMAEFFKV
jgi:hypothetical protein